MNEQMPPEDNPEQGASGARRWSDAELEVARLRDLLELEHGQSDPDLRILARVMNRVDAAQDAPRESASHPVPPMTRTSSRHPSRRPLALAAAAILTVLIVIAAQAIWPRGTAAATPPQLHYPLGEPEDAESAPAADATLAALANAARSQDAPNDDNTVQYVAGFGWYLAFGDDGADAVILPMRTRFWVGDDGSVLSQQDVGQALEPDGTLAIDSSIDTPPHMEDLLPPGTLPEPFVALPENPDQALDFMRFGMCTSTDRVDSCLLEQIGNLATSHVLTPHQLAIIWEALAGTPGVHFLGETTDRAGRQVVALTAGPSRILIGETVIVLLADPTTGEILGVEQTTLSTDAIDLDGPAVTGFTTITDSRLVAAIGES